MHNDLARRRLPRPGEDLADQGLGFDMGTMLSRRRMFRVLGIGAAAAGLTACAGLEVAASTPPSDGVGMAAPREIPDETAGPYPGDGSNGPDVLEQSGIIRSDIRSSFGDSSGVADGVPMTLEFTIQDLEHGGGPFEGVAVYVWHCDREGRYSMYSEGALDQNYLRGVQIADADGKVRYTSIFPACYPGRWPHVHFEVYPDRAGITDASNAIATSQLAFPEQVCDAVYSQPGYQDSVPNLAQLTLQTDGVFGDDGAATQLATVTGDVANGYTVRLAVGVDTGTAPTMGAFDASRPPTGGPPSP